MKRFAFISVLFIYLAVGAIPGHCQFGTYNAMASEILVLVNKHRASIGLAPLKMNETISKLALQHSSDMATRRVPFSHQGFDKRTAGIKKQVGGEIHAFAENVAYGADDAEGAVEMWLSSQGHRENIEGDYNLTGIGIAKSKDGYLYFTQIFARRR